MSKKMFLTDKEVLESSREMTVFDNLGGKDESASKKRRKDVKKKEKRD